MTNKFLLYATAFVTGASVMVIELTASRLLAPFFGTSLYVWTNVVGVIMVALAAGYWLGGAIAERYRDPRLLYGIILASGVTAGLIPFALTPLSSVTLEGIVASSSNGSVTIFLGSFLVLLLLFALPILLLGMVSPYVIRLLTIDDAAVGKVAGRLFAISTGGSILGTFLPALVLVPLLGSRRTIVAAAGALAVVGIAGIAARGSRVKVAVPALAVVLAVALTPAGLRARPGLVEERESPYQYVSVQDEAAYGRTMRFNEGMGIQSAVRPDGGRSGFYWDYLPALLAGTGTTGEGGKKRVLVIGLAGGSIPRMIADSWGDKVETVGVEIDGSVVDLGRRHFGLDDIGGLSVVTEDGRMFLARDEGKYDLILVDAFTNQLYIPPHMATEEFFGMVRGHLAPGGLMALNGFYFSEESPLYGRFSATLHAAFPHVSAYRIPGSYNYLIAAGESAVDWTSLPESAPESVRDLAEEISLGMGELREIGMKPLTDDDSPIEVMTDAQVFEVLKGGR